MVDIVSIVIAVLSLLGTLTATGVTAWFAFFTEERKKRTEADKLLRKYRDPLFQAAKDLQSRLYNIVASQQSGMLSWMRRDELRKDNLVQFTCFLVGQYLAWTYILKRQAQFLPLSTDAASGQLRATLDAIELTFETTQHPESPGGPFQLWRGHQMAIGEIMTVQEGEELYSMGYAAFRQKWTEGEAFRYWFDGLVEDLEFMSEAERRGPYVPDHRLRWLQHLLLQLTHVLDPKGLRIDLSRNERCPQGRGCRCFKCHEVVERPSEKRPVPQV